MSLLRLCVCSLGILIVTISISAQAKLFRNAYVSFELPPSWKCQLEQTEWVCRSENTNDTREAIIILTAKEVGPTDSFDIYESYLKSPKSVTTKTSSTMLSQVIKAGPVQIENQKWIDGWHLNSEVSNYYTRYLATIKDKIAILVTFSAHKLHYTKYSKDFFNAIMSLRVIASRGLLTRPSGEASVPGMETSGIPGSGVPGEMGEGIPEEEGLTNKSQDGTTTAIAIALIAFALGAYLFIKKKKKNR